MEALAAGDYTCTIIGVYESTKILDSELCNYCRWRDDEWAYYYDGQDCECPPDPRHRHVAVMIKVRGNPIIEKPRDCTYDITIWDNVMPQSQCTPETLWDLDPTIHLTLSATVDPSDMEHMYAGLLDKYYPQLVVIQQVEYSFKGPVPRSSYLSDFTARIDALLTSKDRKDGSECAHVERRKKGHSHVRGATAAAAGRS